jgi:hypothetical protein
MVDQVSFTEENKMDYGMIGKIEKAKFYAEDRLNRIQFESFQVKIQGENNSHAVTYDHGSWGCDCDFFASRSVCSHTMTMDRVLENMVEFGVTAA